MTISRIAVLGAGAWGTALANCAARAGASVILWARDRDTCAAIAATRQNPRLPGIRLDDGISVTSDLQDAAETEAVLLVVPSQAVREVASEVADFLVEATPVVACAKGIERGKHLFMTEIIAQCEIGRAHV